MSRNHGELKEHYTKKRIKVKGVKVIIKRTIPNPGWSDGMVRRKNKMVEL